MRSRGWWLLGLASMAVLALFLLMQATNLSMQEEGDQPSPEHLQEHSGDEPREMAPGPSQ